MTQPTVSMLVRNPGTYGDPSYLDVFVSNTSLLWDYWEDSAVLDTGGGGWFDGWCLNPNVFITVNTQYSSEIYSTYELALIPDIFSGSSLLSPKENLDLVNWVINQNFTANPQFNYGEVQSAIWALLGFPYITAGNGLTASGPVSLADVQSIVNAANLFGNDFVPDNDQYIGVILNTGPTVQPVMIELKAAKLGDFVWHDLDADGIQDGNESGIAGATVQLVREIDGAAGFTGNEILATTITDGTGYYEFKGLTPGLTYQVQFAMPTGYEATSPRQLGGDAAKDSDGLVSNTVVLSAGEFNPTIDAGFYQFVTVGDFVWNDLDRDGIQDVNESGIGGVTLTLTGTDGAGNAVSVTTATNGAGGYLFNNLNPGQYQVTVDADNFQVGGALYGYMASPSFQGVDPTQDSNANPSGTTPLILTSGNDDLTLDFGYYAVTGLGDYVWHDLNADGIQNDNEPGINGAVVILLTGAGGYVTQTVTGDNPNVAGTQQGYYQFTNLAPGDYRVLFVQPNGYDAVSPRQQGGDISLDSDGLQSDVVTLLAGQFNSTIDSGFYRLASLGDRVWEDTNANGQQDAGESGIAGVEVELYTCVNDQPGVKVGASTFTDANGNYSFTGLKPGDYIVKFITPTGYTLTTANVGADGSDSDAGLGGITACYNLESGETDRTVDAGLVPVPVEPGILIVKDVLDCDIFVQPYEPVTFTYSVYNTGALALSNIVVIDDNATPDYAGDDFTPTRIADEIGNNDDVLDVGEVWKFEATVIPPVLLTATIDGTPIESGAIIMQEQLANGDWRITFLQSTDINDNNYRASGPAPDWDGDSHTFGNLTGSDKAGFLLKDADGNTVMQFYMDYITSTGTNTDGYSSWSGYASLGVTGGDGSISIGSAANLYDFDSSLELNLNQSGIATNGIAYTGMTANSPVGDANWDYVMAYSFTVKESVFGPSGFGSAIIFDQHNSPPKIGSNSFTPDIGMKASVNTAVVTGIAGTVTVTDHDDATVFVGDAGPQIDVEKYVKVEGYTQFVPMICDTLGKPLAITFDYEPGNTVSNTQGGKAAILATGAAGFDDDDGVSFIRVTDRSSATDTGGRVYFQGTVAEGAQFVASGAGSTFGSTIYIHFFDDATAGGTGLLQTIMYHTSCSQTINLGDVTGNVTLVGYVGENGTIEASGYGEDADTGPGPEALFQSQVEFTYVVTNPGSIALENVNLTDNRLGSPAYVEGDANNNGLLDPGEAWIYTASETALVGQVSNTATVSGTAVGLDCVKPVTDQDDANYIVVGGPAIDVEKYVMVEGYTPFIPLICETLGKPTSLTFDYEVGTTVSNTQGGKGAILTQSGVEDDGRSWVRVTDSSTPTSGRIYFEGYVDVGDTFTATAAAAGQSTFGSATYVHFFDDRPADNVPGSLGLLQSLTYHTSCSQPINLGDVTGNATLVGYTGENGTVDTTVFYGEDADVGPGPEAQFGSTVDFVYVVTNPGGTALEITLTDDRLSSLTYVEGDADGDGLLDPGETWIYTASETALVGQVTNIGTVIGIAVDEAGNPLGLEAVQDADAANYIVVGGPAIDVEKYVMVEGYTPFTPLICETLGKPTSLTFDYEVGTTVSNTQGGKGAILTQSGVEDDGRSWVRVTDSSTPTSGRIYFEGYVDVGDTFTATAAAAGQSTFGSATYVHFFDDRPADNVPGSLGLLQSLTYHTSCSQPINLGDVTGNATLVGYTGENGTVDTTVFYGVDADTAPGVLAELGSTVTFNYVVTNPGSAPLTGIILSDDRLGAPVYVSGDDGDGVLQAGETWLYTATELVTSESLVTNFATVTGTAVGYPGLPNVTDVDAGNYTGYSVKFFVVDQVSDGTFKYSAAGAGVGSFSLHSGNVESRDVASNADGSTLWVLDKNKNVYVYDTAGSNPTAVWKADGLGSEPEGITLDGDDLWLADRSRKIFWYDNAANNTSGTDNPEKSFSPSMSGNLKGIVTDGDYLWAVTEGGTDYVYRFTINRDGSGTPTGLTQSGLWTLASANSKPTGITLDPTGASTSLWVVDESSDTVYEYADGRNLTSGTAVASASFQLAAGNTAPQGIADPMAFSSGLVEDEGISYITAAQSDAGGTTTAQSMSDLLDGILDAMASYDDAPYAGFEAANDSLAFDSGLIDPVTLVGYQQDQAQQYAVA